MVNDFPGKSEIHFFWERVGNETHLTLEVIDRIDCSCSNTGLKMINELGEIRTQYIYTPNGFKFSKSKASTDFTRSVFFENSSVLKTLAPILVLESNDISAVVNAAIKNVEDQAITELNRLCTSNLKKLSSADSGICKNFLDELKEIEKKSDVLPLFRVFEAIQKIIPVLLFLREKSLREEDAKEYKDLRVIFKQILSQFDIILSDAYALSFLNPQQIAYLQIMLALTDEAYLLKALNNEDVITILKSQEEHEQNLFCELFRRYANDLGVVEQFIKAGLVELPMMIGTNFYNAQSRMEALHAATNEEEKQLLIIEYLSDPEIDPVMRKKNLDYYVKQSKEIPWNLMTAEQFTHLFAADPENPILRQQITTPSTFKRMWGAVDSGLKNWGVNLDKQIPPSIYVKLHDLSKDSNCTSTEILCLYNAVFDLAGAGLNTHLSNLKKSSLHKHLEMTDKSFGNNDNAKKNKVTMSLDDNINTNTHASQDPSTDNLKTPKKISSLSPAINSNINLLQDPIIDKLIIDKIKSFFERNKNLHFDLLSHIFMNRELLHYDIKMEPVFACLNEEYILIKFLQSGNYELINTMLSDSEMRAAIEDMPIYDLLAIMNILEKSPENGFFARAILNQKNSEDCHENWHEVKFKLMKLILPKLVRVFDLRTASVSEIHEMVSALILNKAAQASKIFVSLNSDVIEAFLIYAKLFDLVREHPFPELKLDINILEAGLNAILTLNFDFELLIETISKICKAEPSLFHAFINKKPDEDLNAKSGENSKEKLGTNLKIILKALKTLQGVDKLKNIPNICDVLCDIDFQVRLLDFVNDTCLDALALAEAWLLNSDKKLPKFYCELIDAQYKLLYINDDDLQTFYNCYANRIELTTFESPAQTISRVTNNGLEFQKILNDTHSLYDAVSHYLKIDPETLKNIVETQVEQNIDTYRSYITSLDPNKSFEENIQAIKNGAEWAVHLKVLLLMQALDEPIVMIGPDGQTRNQKDFEKFSKDPIFVYYDPAYNHFSSLRLSNSNQANAKEILARLTPYKLPYEKKGTESLEIEIDIPKTPLENEKKEIKPIKDLTPAEINTHYFNMPAEKAAKYCFDNMEPVIVVNTNLATTNTPAPIATPVKTSDTLVPIATPVKTSDTSVPIATPLKATSTAAVIATPVKTSDTPVPIVTPATTTNTPARMATPLKTKNSPRKETIKINVNIFERQKIQTQPLKELIYSEHLSRLYETLKSAVTNARTAYDAMFSSSGPTLFHGAVGQMRASTLITKIGNITNDPSDVQWQVKETIRLIISEVEQSNKYPLSFATFLVKKISTALKDQTLFKGKDFEVKSEYSHQEFSDFITRLNNCMLIEESLQATLVSPVPQLASANPVTPA